MTLRLVSVAERELAEAVEYYEREQSGLGGRFLDEIQATLLRIAAHPEAWTRIAPRTHRCRVHHFPFGLCYQVRKKEIVIVAVMDLRRDPRRWDERW